MIKEFDKPLDEWIEEEIEVPTIEPVLNKSGKVVKLKKTIRKATQKTFYSRGKSRKVLCGDHEYYSLDKGKYLFRCKHCDWRMIAPPINFKFDEKTGKLTHRETGIQH